MKKILLLLVMIITMQYIYACEICGGSSAGSYFGILPDYKTNFIAFKHRYRSFTSRHLTESSEPEMTSADRFHTAEIWGRINLNKRLQLFAILPLNFYSQKTDAGITNSNGIGDVSLQLSYILINTSGDKKSVQQLLQLGAGIKLPTGAHKVVSNGEKLHQNMQPGSGTFDFPISLIYTIRKKNIGLSTEASYRINTFNKDNIAYGNKFTSSARSFYVVTKRSTSIIPHAGISFEFAGKDFDGIEVNNYSGGKVINFVTGVDLHLKRFSLGFGWQQPIKSDLAQGRITPHASFNSSINILF